jgi:UDP-glucuronate decarboxylase
MNEVVQEDIRQILSQDLPWESLEGLTVLITGATGMVGYYAVASLLSLPQERGINVNVLALARNEEKAKKLFGGLAVDNLTIVHQDVSYPISIEDKVDLVVHAASPANPTMFKEDPVGVIRANVLGSFNALDLARENDAKYCFISTMEVYGQIDSEEDIYVKEDDYGRLNSLEQRSAYPESKRASENLAVAYGAQHGVDYTIARLTHTYGPGMDINDSRVQTEFMRNAVAGNDIVLKSDGSLKRTYTYIADAVSGMFYAIMKDSGERVYNVANEEAKLSIKELAQTVIDVSGNDAKLVIDIDKDAAKFWSKTKNTYVDCSRLKSLGWDPKVSPSEGFERTMKFHKDNASSESK